MNVLIFIHSVIRWLLFLTLIGTITVSIYRKLKHLPFTPPVNSLRHWTATAAHIQLVVGMILLINSPQSTYFWQNLPEAAQLITPLFYGVIHPFLMLSSIVVITIGSAKAKRTTGNLLKYKTIIYWYLTALILLLIAIPWPFSPFSSRSLIPHF